MAENRYMSELGGAQRKPRPGILVVDDTPENLRLLSGMLGERGLEVRPVTSGRMALKAAARQPPDLVLLDVNMPEMDGFEVCRRLREEPGTRDVPVIFLTALTDHGDKVKAFAAGGVDYITKPFHIDEVMARVKTHLELHQARRELAAHLSRLNSSATIWSTWWCMTCGHR
jgi:DNA-binding response OmpR family regulator